MREITEYDGYKIEFPYLGKQLTDKEEAERIKKLEEAKEKARKEMNKFL